MINWTELSTPLRLCIVLLWICIFQSPMNIEYYDFIIVMAILCFFGTMESGVLVLFRAVHESRLSSLESSPESHVSSLESLFFPGAESRVKSWVISLESWVESRVIILESESSRVIAKVSLVMSWVIIAQLVVLSKLVTIVKWKAYLTIWNDHCWCCSFYLFWVTVIKFLFIYVECKN